MTDEIYNLVDRGITEWREDAYRALRAIGIDVHDLIAQVNTPSCCWICGSTRKLAPHHIAGEKHDHRTAPVCPVCHAWLSNEQKTWDRRWLLQNQSMNLRQAFLLQGLRDMLRLKARKTGDSNYETLGDRYTEDIKRLLEATP